MRMATINIRKAAPADGNGIAELIKENYNIKTFAEAGEFCDRDFNSGMNYLIAETDGKIVGFATWRMHDRPYHELAELHAIAVSNAFKGKGIAKELFDAALNDAKEFFISKGHSLRKFYLLAHANNEKAIKFYRKVGMKEETKIPNHYYKGIDEVVMAMYLK